MTAVKKIHSHTASIWKIYIDRYQFDSWCKGHKTIIKFPVKVSAHTCRYSILAI